MMVNGIVYDFESLKLMLPTGLTILLESVNYGDKKADEVITGHNNIPVGVGQGEYSGECEVEIGRIEYDKFNLSAAAAGGFYNMAPVPMVVSYGHAGQVPVTDSLTVHFTERKFGGSKGDTSLNVTLKGSFTMPMVSNGVPAYVPM
jgi:hypothetical protein